LLAESRLPPAVEKYIRSEENSRLQLIPISGVAVSRCIHPAQLGDGANSHAFMVDCDFIPASAKLCVIIIILHDGYYNNHHAG